MSPDQREAREIEDFPEQQDLQEKEARKVRVACVMLTAQSGSISVDRVYGWEGFAEVSLKSVSHCHLVVLCPISYPSTALLLCNHVTSLCNSGDVEN